MKPTDPADDPLNASQLARVLKRSRWGVKQCIERLEIAPVQTLGGVDYYDASIVARLRESMRRANHTAA